MKNKLCVALDVNTLAAAESLVSRLHPYVGVFKVGLELFTAKGPDIIRTVKSVGGEVFLDLKFHDIPNTVKKTAEVVTKMGVKMFNIHCSGGTEMMLNVVNHVQEISDKENIRRPIILGVSVLTSISQQVFNNELKHKGNIINQVDHLALLSYYSGLDGVVCSPNEIRAVRAIIPGNNEFMIVTPGIRPTWSDPNEQKRITTPFDAIVEGSDLIVVGRPIIEAEHPIEAAEKILAEMEEAEKTRLIVNAPPAYTMDYLAR